MGQKMEAIGWGRNLQLRVRLFELRFSPELFRTGASGPKKSKLQQEKGFQMLMRFIVFMCPLQHRRYRGGEKGGSRVQS